MKERGLGGGRGGESGREGGREGGWMGGGEEGEVFTIECQEEAGSGGAGRGVRSVAGARG
jgi:hypothetical protein